MCSLMLFSSKLDDLTKTLNQTDSDKHTEDTSVKSGTEEQWRLEGCGGRQSW
ncbi:hypothetical protein GMA8713_04213 [Grimontia marina]|uniref:Uncharacterized protein n=1 Tax=Grimontia marina TaxID=646534 RepID=A0A128FHZ2_9GAMM|nr:hypothetical protein GMA8713_04213 [Grimontia marina]